MTDHLKAFNAQEAADFLNAHVETIRRLARKGSIPSFKVGKDWRFRKEDLLAWAQAHYPRNNHPPTILIVEDDQQLRRLMLQLLKKEGFQIIEAENGEVGLECLQDQSVDLILLDLEMPVMSGVQFLTQLRQRQLEIPVVLVTGHPDGALMRDAMEYSPLLLIAKPFNRKHLLRTVKAVVSPPEITAQI